MLDQGGPEIHGQVPLEEAGRRLPGGLMKRKADSEREKKKEEGGQIWKPQ